MTAESKHSTASSLSLAVSVKLSPFCPGEATSWFRGAEIQFRLRKVTDPCTKADYVLEAIPEQLANKPRRVDLLRELWLQRLPPNVRSEPARSRRQSHG
ncbi:hypothetical protein Pcinc_018029 [Petrolisthes cinctipes]|uniref:DUF7041 domain-containing protein n=1 Tax=Petrolisthes cinctipes TaxID=88211 RepID=A0AAE1FN40_PETCI|nr:hypothetical protein Pcinc_018029 [Petrolisthes cinctipes]